MSLSFYLEGIDWFDGLHVSAKVELDSLDEVRARRMAWNWAAVGLVEGCCNVTSGMGMGKEVMRGVTRNPEPSRVVTQTVTGCAWCVSTIEKTRQGRCLFGRWMGQAREIMEYVMGRKGDEAVEADEKEGLEAIIAGQATVRVK